MKVFQKYDLKGGENGEASDPDDLDDPDDPDDPHPTAEELKLHRFVAKKSAAAGF